MSCHMELPHEEYDEEYFVPDYERERSYDQDYEQEHRYDCDHDYRCYNYDCDYEDVCEYDEDDCHIPDYWCDTEYEFIPPRKRLGEKSKNKQYVLGLDSTAAMLSKCTTEEECRVIEEALDLAGIKISLIECVVKDGAHVMLLPFGPIEIKKEHKKVCKHEIVDVENDGCPEGYTTKLLEKK